jgi:hypothetical protein
MGLRALEAGAVWQARLIQRAPERNLAAGALIATSPEPAGTGISESKLPALRPPGYWLILAHNFLDMLTP